MRNSGSGPSRLDAAPPERTVAQLALPLETLPALGREDFIVTPANREAVAFIDAYPDWASSAVALYGPGGSGKSHLVSAWAKKTNANVVGAAALDQRILNDGNAPLAVENVDTGAGDAARDAILFALFERGRPLLLTGREPPSQWPATMPDLISRYRAMVSFPLWVPDETLLRAMARKLFDDRQLTVPDAVIDYLIRSIERSPAAIRDAVTRADAKALAEKRPVTVALVREILAERQGALF